MVKYGPDMVCPLCNRIHKDIKPESDNVQMDEIRYYNLNTHNFGFIKTVCKDCRKVFDEKAVKVLNELYNQLKKEGIKQEN